MMEPDYSHGYLRVPLEVWMTVFCQAPLTRRQLQILAFVLRESWGWQRPDGHVHLWTRPLSPRHFAAGTGLSTDHLRRDLDYLICRGMLCQSRMRYQFVPEPELWITPKPQPQIRRQIAPKSPDLPATLAPPAPASKKRERKQRNVFSAPDRDFSTGGEIPSSRASLAAFAGARSSAPAAARLVQIIVSFVGDLSPSQNNELLRWIHQAGIAAVWSALEPILRRRPDDRRSQVAAILDEGSVR